MKIQCFGKEACFVSLLQNEQGFILQFQLPAITQGVLSVLLYNILSVNELSLNPMVHPYLSISLNYNLESIISGVIYYVKISMKKPELERERVT